MTIERRGASGTDIRRGSRHPQRPLEAPAQANTGPADHADVARPMKIAHVGWGHYPAHRTAGPIIYLHTLALAQARAGDEVTIVCASDRHIPDAPPYATQTEIVEGITYVHVCNRPANMHEPWNPLREAHDPQCEQAFDAVFAELQPDVVHVHNYVGLSFDIV